MIVHMGTCGIAAGARDVLAELVNELDRRKVDTVTRAPVRAASVSATRSPC